MKSAVCYVFNCTLVYIIAVSLFTTVECPAVNADLFDVIHFADVWSQKISPHH